MDTQGTEVNEGEMAYANTNQIPLYAGQARGRKVSGVVASSSLGPAELHNNSGLANLPKTIVMKRQPQNSQSGVIMPPIQQQS